MSADWVGTPAPCHNCPHSWHALPCMDCFCETSCLSARVIIPPNIVLGEN